MLEPVSDGAAAAQAGVGVAIAIEVEQARGLLARVTEELNRVLLAMRAQGQSELVETNEQLVLSMLRTQSETIAAAQAIAFREATTELRLEARRLSEENRVMRETFRLKSQFVGNMSHELRTPLNAIIGLAGLLRSGKLAPGSPQYERYVGQIQSSADLLLRQVDAMLVLSKAASRTLEFHPGRVDWQPLLDEVVGAIEGEAHKRGLRITTDVQADLTEVVVDVAALKLVLANLLSNAIKFSHDGASIALRVRAEGAARFRVEVEDQGIGIAPERQHGLFTHFEQLDSGLSRRFSGKGLGLGLSRLLVEAQGGTIGCDSALGRGSTFHLVLDRQPSLPVPAAVAGDDAASSGA